MLSLYVKEFDDSSYNFAKPLEIIYQLLAEHFIEEQVYFKVLPKLGIDDNRKKLVLLETIEFEEYLFTYSFYENLHVCVTELYNKCNLKKLNSIPPNSEQSAYTFIPTGINNAFV